MIRSYIDISTVELSGTRDSTVESFYTRPLYICHFIFVNVFLLIFCIVLDRSFFKIVDDKLFLRKV